MSRHARNDRCPRCHAARFTVEKGFTKPTFKCENGCHTWQSGRDGMPFLPYAKNFRHGQIANDFVGLVWRNGRLVEAKP